MRQERISLIINADDYGLTPGVTTAINHLLDDGCISNTTAMMAVPGSLDTQTSQRVDVDTRRIGVHLQLSSGVALVAGAKHCDPETGAFLGQSYFEDASPEEVHVEWAAQIAAFQKLYGHAPSHLDSHHGPHRYSHLLPVYAALAKEWNVPVRAGSSSSHALRQEGLVFAECYLSDWTGSGELVDALLSSLDAARSQRPAAVEVVAHPGIVDNDLFNVSSLNVNRGMDYRELLKINDDLLSEIGYCLRPYEGE